MVTVRKIRKRKSRKYAVVVSRFNEFIGQRLLDGCLDEFRKQGVGDRDLTVVWVPGAFEIPVAALTFARKKEIAAVICLGAVIRGETSHFDYVAQGATDGIARVSLMTGKPVIFGVLTTDTVQQAYQRSETKGDNKGRSAAEAAVEMTETLDSI